MEQSFENEQGLKLTVTDRFDGEYYPIIGGDNSNPSWKEYVEQHKEEYRPHVELIKKAITEMGWVGETGETKANYFCFVFSDGNAWSYSWRAWGDLMQAIVDKKEGYMTYYM